MAVIKTISVFFLIICALYKLAQLCTKASDKDLKYDILYFIELLVCIVGSILIYTIGG